MCLMLCLPLMRHPDFILEPKHRDTITASIEHVRKNPIGLPFNYRSFGLTPTMGDLAKLYTTDCRSCKIQLARCICAVSRSRNLEWLAHKVARHRIATASGNSQFCPDLTLEILASCQTKEAVVCFCLQCLSSGAFWGQNFLRIQSEGD